MAAVDFAAAAGALKAGGLLGGEKAVLQVAAGIAVGCLSTCRMPCPAWTRRTRRWSPVRCPAGGRTGDDDRRLPGPP